MGNHPRGLIDKGEDTPGSFAQRPAAGMDETLGRSRENRIQYRNVCMVAVQRVERVCGRSPSPDELLVHQSREGQFR